jgi:uncharacterized protein (UPF0548 family)
MFNLRIPGPSSIQEFINHQIELPHSYAAVGHTRNGGTVPGFDHDFNQVELGKGPAAWDAAKAAIRQWKMFPGTWARIEPANAPIRPGIVVAMLARVMGFWWMNSCRIVYVIDSEWQFGFAYGTLPGHVEKGEELFLVEKDASGTVRYSIRAFSTPRFWLARLAYPMARRYQKRFVRDSKTSMIKFVQSTISKK